VRKLAETTRQESPDDDTVERWSAYGSPSPRSSIASKQAGRPYARADLKGLFWKYFFRLLLLAIAAAEWLCTWWLLSGLTGWRAPELAACRRPLAIHVLNTAILRSVPPKAGVALNAPNLYRLRIQLGLRTALHFRARRGVRGGVGRRGTGRSRARAQAVRRRRSHDRHRRAARHRCRHSARIHARPAACVVNGSASPCQVCRAGWTGFESPS
jgi:hypothetical protein